MVLCLSGLASAVGPSAAVAGVEMGNGVARRKTGKTRGAEEKKRGAEEKKRGAKASQSERAKPRVGIEGLRKLFVLDVPGLFLHTIEKRYGFIDD